MKKILIIIIINCFALASFSQSPTNDFNNHLYADFDPWCTIFEANNGSPANLSCILAAANAAQNSPPHQDFCESMVADFNFVKDASYSVDVNISLLQLGLNTKGSLKVILVNNPTKLGCVGIGTPTPQPTPSFPGHFLLTEQVFTSDISNKNIHIEFKSPNDFNSIVIFAQDKDPKWGTNELGYFVRFWFNCVSVNLECYSQSAIAEEEVFDYVIPTGITEAKNIYIGSSLGSNPGGSAFNPVYNNTDLRAAESIQFINNTRIEPRNNHFFMAQIYNYCDLEGGFSHEPEVTVVDEKGCAGYIPPSKPEPTDDNPDILPNMVGNGEQDMSHISLKNSKESNTQLTIYPNPVNRTFKIDYASSVNITKISVYDMYGRMIKEWNSSRGNYELPSLANGSYLVKILVSDQDEPIIRKINIKQ